MGTEDLQRNFEGYLNTSLLWYNAEVYGLQQYDLKEPVSPLFTEQIINYLRLGKLVERFVFHQLHDDPFCTILTENIQIQDGKRTIGEMDALLTHKKIPIHLEIVYKFYVYDPNVGNDELSHWIGPNRKDSLIQKLDKLKEKQLPLLYHPKTQSLIGDLGLTLKEIKQQVVFKAQLFLPLHQGEILFSVLNPNAVEGFYVKKNEIEQFKTAQFYIPEKTNWLMAIDKSVIWLNYDDFTIQISKSLDRKMAPLCWLNQNGVLSKFFVVWW